MDSGVIFSNQLSIDLALHRMFTLQEHMLIFLIWTRNFKFERVSKLFERRVCDGYID